MVKNSWYDYVAGGAIGVLLFILLSYAISPIAFSDLLPSTLLFDYLKINSVFITILLPPIIVYRLFHRDRVVNLFSYKGFYSFKSMFFGFIVWFSFQFVSLVYEFIFQGGNIVFTSDLKLTMIFLVVSIPVTLLQITGEEVLFRGYLIKFLKSFIKNRVLLTVLPALLFALPHLWNPEVKGEIVPFFLVYFVMALFLTYLAIEKKGLEYSIGIHMANNYFAVNFLNYPDAPIKSSPFFYMGRELDPWESLLFLIIFITITIIIINIRERKMVKNIVFDLGRVLINWDLEKFAQSYTDCEKLQRDIVDNIFTHKDWHLLDKGVITEEEAVERFAKRLKLDTNEINKIIFEARKIMTLKERTYSELKRLKDKYNIYCLSNMSHGSWQVVKSEHDFINYFDDIIISAEIKLIKPEPEIFKYCLSKFSIDPMETVFIDDLKENIESAEAHGIRGIHFDESKECWKKIEKL